MKSRLSGNLIATVIMIVMFQDGRAQFIKGADISWLPQMEATGYIFYDSTGSQKDCLQILKDHSINTVRIRVWVNPSDDRINGHCSKKEISALALRAKNLGMRIMIDFHYSDTWADPGHQTKPAAWANDNFPQVLQHVYDHTYEVLDTLVSIGARPDWVQAGNEIPSGMLWPEGSTSNWPQLAQLLNKAYDAVKAVDSSIKVIIHLDQGNNNSRFRYFFDQAELYNVSYDIIGASYYPYWLGSDYTNTIDDLGNNLDDLSARYGKEVMVVETGGDYSLVQNTYDMLVAVMNKVNAVPNGKGLGVLYWEPEGEKSWSNYQLSCWGSDGKPTGALKAFLISPLGIIENKAIPDLIIYPNPFFGGLLYIEVNDFPRFSAFEIYDAQGGFVKMFDLGKRQKASFDINLEPGIYFIRGNNGKNSFLGKLLVSF